MKKLYSIVLMAAALLIGTNMRAVEVSDLAGLKTALGTGGDITLTADIPNVNELLVIEKGVTINGGNYHIYGTGGTNASAKYIFHVKTSDPVIFKDVVIYGENARCIVAEHTNNVDITLDGVTLNAGNNRAMDVMDVDGAQVLVENSLFQLVEGISVDTYGNPNVAADFYDKNVLGSFSRGLNIGRLTNSTLEVNNTTMQGFYYNLNNIGGTMAGTTLTTSNSTYKGRCALNVWGKDGTFEVNDAYVVGINNYGGTQESFACFVINKNDETVAERNHLTINGGTLVAASFNAVGMANSNACQYLLRDQGIDNVVVINNASYTCTKEAGDSKGGVIEQTSSTSDITINGGNYDCPSIVGATNSSDGQTGTITITGGEFTVNTVAPDMNNSNVYSTIEIEGGTFVVPDPETGNNVDIATLEDPNNPGNKLISSTVGTITNQNGTVSVVPTETKNNTSSAVATEIEWNDANDWTVPAATSNVVIAANQTVTLEGAAGAAYHIDMGDGAKLIVKNGTTLTIGEGGVSLYNGGAAKPQIVIEQGAKVITYGLMYNSVTENLIIKASAAGYGQLLIDPQVQAHGDNHPNGTVEFVSKSWYTDGEHYQWERFGIPTWNKLKSIATTCNSAVAMFENNGWTQLGYVYASGTPEFANIDKLDKPFVTYNMLAYRTQSETAATYTFKGELVGNTNAALNADREWNGYPNSYMADMDAAAILTGLASATNVEKVIYLPRYHGNGYYTWDAQDVDWLDGTKVAPMQSFILRNGNSAEAEAITLSYKNTVWNPGTGAAGAPRRFAKTNDNTAKLRIIVTNENGIWDNVKMTESATNNHNAVKYMNDDVNIYAMADEKEAIVAAENLENTYVGFSTVKGGKFTISFANVEGREFALVDHETGAQVAMVEGATYEFTAAANSTNDYRFEIVEPAKLPTAIENAEAVKSAKGIYTITGQYVGEMNVWNTLPAGIYVVNGEKLVK